jgi:hypothetical protein
MLGSTGAFERLPHWHDVCWISLAAQQCPHDAHCLCIQRQKLTHCDSRVPSIFMGYLSMNAKTIAAEPTAAELAEVDSECSPVPIQSPVVRGVWTRDIEALCRALDAQQRAHFRRIDEEKK